MVVGRHRHPLLDPSQLLVELEQVVVDRGQCVLLTLLLAGQLGVDGLPLLLDRCLQLGLGGVELVDLRLYRGDTGPGGVDVLEHAENSLLHGSTLALEALNLETHVLGLPGTHTAGEQSGLVLFELELEQFQLPLRLVEIELQLLEMGGIGVQLALLLLHLLVGRLVVLQFGKRLALIEEAVDLEVHLLQVEEIGEAGQLHVDQRG
jgi:hypothetical protein